MNTLKAGLIGEHISRSRFPAALQNLCERYSLRLEFQLIDTAGQDDFDLEDRLTQARADGWSGMSITHPFKARAAVWAGAAMVRGGAHLGAANTLVFGPPLAGHNTDFSGFKSAFAGLDGPPAPGRVVMIGAGGVARALAPAILDLGAEAIWINDANMAAAHALSTQLGPRAHAVEGADLTSALRDATGLINATPVGTVEYPGSAFDLDQIGPQVWAFDAVYTPVWTPFLATARDRGLVTLTGFDLFRHMAIGSFAAFTGLIPDPSEALPLLDRLKPEVAHA